MAPSGSAKVAHLSSGPTSRATDAPNGVRVGAGCFVVSAGLAMLVLRCAPSSPNYLLRNTDTARTRIAHSKKPHD
jgi:hypothetical protein